jgi:hypothetical protein
MQLVHLLLNLITTQSLWVVIVFLLVIFATSNYSTSVMLLVITCYIVEQCNHCPRLYIPCLILASSHLEVLVASVYNGTTCKRFEVFSFYDCSISIHILLFSYSLMLSLMPCDTNDQLEGFDIHVCSCMQSAKKVMGTMRTNYFLLQCLLVFTSTL